MGITASLAVYKRPVSFSIYKAGREAKSGDIGVDLTGLAILVWFCQSAFALMDFM